MSSPIDAARARRAISPKLAREQVAEFHGFAASVDLQIGDEVFEIPSPNLLDDDQQERFNELNAYIEKNCDREDDIEIPESKLDNGRVMPAQTVRGDVKRPYAINGEPLRPAYNTRLAIALFGEEGYARFKAGGGRSNQIALTWAQMNREFEDRKESDPKSGGDVKDSASLSNGSSVGLVSVPPPPDS